MRRKTLIRAGIVVVTLGGLLAALVLMLRHEPGFYRHKQIPPGAARSKESGVCEGLIAQLVTSLKEDVEFEATVSEAQINSYLQERFINSGLSQTVLSKGVSDPRVQIDGDVVHLGFRYGEPPWSTIVSIDFRLWRTPNETNVVALQLLGLRAGMVPLSSKFLMDRVTSLIRGSNGDIDISWYRHEGCLVALLRFGSSRQRYNPLDRFDVRDGKFTVVARPPGAARASIPAASSAAPAKP